MYDDSEKITLLLIFFTQFQVLLFPLLETASSSCSGLNSTLVTSWELMKYSWKEPLLSLDIRSSSTTLTANTSKTVLMTLSRRSLGKLGGRGRLGTASLCHFSGLLGIAESPCSFFGASLADSKAEAPAASQPPQVVAAAAPAAAAEGAALAGRV